MEGGGGGGVKEETHPLSANSISYVTFPKIRISSKTFVTFSFNLFARSL